MTGMYSQNRQGNNNTYKSTSPQNQGLTTRKALGRRANATTNTTKRRQDYRGPPNKRPDRTSRDEPDHQGKTSRNLVKSIRTKSTSKRCTGSTRSRISVSLVDRSKGNFTLVRVNEQIGDYPLTSLLDIGSTLNLIWLSTAQKMKIQVVRVETDITGICGIVNGCVRTEPIEFVIVNNTYNEPFYVLRSGSAM